MDLPVSLEFFPPKTPEGAAKLRVARQALYALKPEFCSVTYGAGGSTHEGTFGTVGEILAEGVDGASHFSCIGATQDKVREQLVELKSMGVKRLVALRGDLPSGWGAGGEFQFASDLVGFIRAQTGNDFRIEVACYPEAHPQSRSPEADLQAYAAKVRAGADSAITQYFYNADAYFRFVQDLGNTGPDKGQGGKYLFVPPGYTGANGRPFLIPIAAKRPTVSESTKSAGSLCTTALISS